MSAENQQPTEAIRIAAANLLTAYVTKNALDPSKISEVYNIMLQTISGTAPAVAAVVEAPRKEPFVPVKKSIFPDYLVCLEDGRKMKTLKRHLRTSFGLTPEEYRAKWDLPHDYPMVAPNYAEHRSQLAKQLGLGRKAGEIETVDEAASAPTPEATGKEVAIVAAKPTRQPRATATATAKVLKPGKKAQNQARNKTAAK